MGYRQLFDIWRKNAEKMSVVMQADEFGETREELKKYKWLLMNLRSMLIEDGYRPSEIN